MERDFLLKTAVVMNSLKWNHDMIAMYSPHHVHLQGAIVATGQKLPTAKLARKTTRSSRC